MSKVYGGKQWLAGQACFADSAIVPGVYVTAQQAVLRVPVVLAPTDDDTTNLTIFGLRYNAPLT